MTDEKDQTEKSTETPAATYVELEAWLRERGRDMKDAAALEAQMPPALQTLVQAARARAVAAESTRRWEFTARLEQSRYEAQAKLEERAKAAAESALRLAEAQAQRARDMEAARVAREAYEQTPEGQAELAALAEKHRLEAVADERQRVYARARELDARGVLPNTHLRTLAEGDVRKGPLFRSPLLRATQLAVSWADEHGTGLVLFLSGPAGCGKTVALSRRVACGPQGSRFAYARDVARLLSARYGEEAERAEAYAQVPLLALDEAGFEHDPELIAELLIRRFDAGRVTLLASNLDLEGLDARYLHGVAGAERLESRLAGQQRQGQPWWAQGPSEDLRQGGPPTVEGGRGEG